MDCFRKSFDVGYGSVFDSRFLKCRSSGGKVKAGESEPSLCRRLSNGDGLHFASGEEELSECKPTERSSYDIVCLGKVGDFVVEKSGEGRKQE